MPQCAIAQRGSVRATSRNACSDASYAKECSNATARLNAAPTWGEHEVSKAMLPSFSGGGWECSSAASAGSVQASIATDVRNGVFMARSYCAQQVAYTP